MDIICRGIGIATVVLSLVLCACRFEVPNAQEGQTLVNSGTFPGKVPSWVMQSKSERPQPVANAGVVPQSYSVPTAVAVSKESVPDINSMNAEKAVEEQEVQRQRELQKAKTDAAALDESKKKSPKEDSPLDRIVKLCPGIESAVADAIQTAEKQARINKYSKLTQRCPQSWDLWLWLGKDYESADKLVEASRCYEKVLTLDYGNEVAQALLANVKKRLSAPAAKGGKSK